MEDLNNNSAEAHQMHEKLMQQRLGLAGSLLTQMIRADKNIGWNSTPHDELVENLLDLSGKLLMKHYTTPLPKADEADEADDEATGEVEESEE